MKQQALDKKQELPELNLDKPQKTISKKDKSKNNDKSSNHKGNNNQSKTIITKVGKLIHSISKLPSYKFVEDISNIHLKKMITGLFVAISFITIFGIVIGIPFFLLILFFKYSTILGYVVITIITLYIIGSLFISPSNQKIINKKEVNKNGRKRNKR